jgi:hypothetical protein
MFHENGVTKSETWVNKSDELIVRIIPRIPSYVSRVLTRLSRVFFTTYPGSLFNEMEGGANLVLTFRSV